MVGGGDGDGDGLPSVEEWCGGVELDACEGCALEGCVVDVAAVSVEGDEDGGEVGGVVLGSLDGFAVVEVFGEDAEVEGVGVGDGVKVDVDECVDVGVEDDAWGGFVVLVLAEELAEIHVGGVAFKEAFVVGRAHEVTLVLCPVAYPGVDVWEGGATEGEVLVFCHGGWGFWGFWGGVGLLGCPRKNVGTVVATPLALLTGEGSGERVYFPTLL